jgi:hypothetical protein
VRPETETGPSRNIGSNAGAIGNTRIDSRAVGRSSSRPRDRHAGNGHGGIVFIK